MKIIHRILQHAQRAPDSPAITVHSASPNTLSYSELVKKTSQYQSFLNDEVEGMDFVFFLSNRSVDLVAAVLSCFALSVPVAILDPRLGPLKIGKILSETGSAFGLVDDLGERLLEKAGLTENEVKFKHFSECSYKEPEISVNKKRSENSATDHSAVILFTSGSTGESKGVKISSEDIGERLSTEVDWFELDESDAILGVLPLNFDVGLTQLLSTLYCGAHHVLLNSWLPKDIIKNVNAYSPKGLALSPMVWKSLLDVPDEELLWGTINSLRYITLSGGTLPKKQLEKIAVNLSTCTLIKTYGQTEMFRISSLKVKGNLDKLGSVGKGYPGVSFQVVNEDNLPCQSNQIGEIVASGCGAMQGYISKDHPLQKNDKAVVYTGDFGYVDEDGYLHVKGRKDEMVKIFDQRIYPEDVASSISAVLNEVDVVVIAIQEQGEYCLVGFIKNSGERKYLGEGNKEAIRKLSQNIASHLIPKYLIELDSFPSTISGKIDKVELLNIFLKQSSDQ